MSPPNSRWSSLVFFYVLLHLSHAYLFSFSFSKKKKLHLDLSVSSLFFLFLFCIFCIQFLANPPDNSLQIFVRSYMFSELRWQVFFSVLNSVSPTCSFRSNRIFSVPPKYATRCHRLCNQKNSLPLVLHFFWSSSTQWILSSTSITILSFALCWVSRTKPIRRTPESPSWKLMSKGEREITSKLAGERDHIKAHQSSRGRESLKDPRCC